jgi:threonine dehydrogenase-like Zn-dependent dehydrogenase
MTELREFPMPDIDEDSALLEVEVAGICGTDVTMYAKPPFTAEQTRCRADHHDRHDTDAARLDLANGLGADTVVDVQREDPLARAIRALAGETGDDAIHISLLPWKEKA